MKVIPKIHYGDNREKFNSNWKQYKFIVNTGRKQNAGTRAKITFQIIGENKTLPPFCFPCKKATSNKYFDFDEGSQNFVIIKSEDLKLIKSIKITNHGKRTSDKWKLDSIVIEDLSTSKSWTFPTHHWITPYHMDYSFDNYLYPARSRFTNYDLIVFTGDQGDSNDKIVCLQLFGAVGTSNEIILGKPDVPCFQKGSTDVFHQIIRDIGVVDKIRVGLISPAASTSWHLKRVEVCHRECKRSVVFPCYQTLEAHQENVYVTINGISRERRKKSFYRFTIYSQPLESSTVDGFLYAFLGNETSESERIILSESLEFFTEKCINYFNVKCGGMSGITSLRLMNDSRMDKRIWIDKIVVEDEGGNKYKFIFADYMKSDSSHLLSALPCDAAGDTIFYHIFVNIGKSSDSEKMSDVDLELVGGDEGRTVVESVALDKNRINLERANHFRAKFDKKLNIIKSIKVDCHRDAHFHLEDIKVINSTTGLVQLFKHGGSLGGGTGAVLHEEAKRRETIYAKGITFDSWQIILSTKRNLKEMDFEVRLFGSADVSDILKVMINPKSDEATYETAKIGHPTKMHVWPNSLIFTKITLCDLNSGNFYVFYGDSWSRRSQKDDQSNFIEIPSEGPTVPFPSTFVEYSVKLRLKHTGRDKSRLLVELIGRNNDSTGERLFPCHDKSEQMHSEEYRFSGLLVRGIRQLRIGHLDGRPNSGMFLESAIVQCEDQWEEFLCGRWFSENKEDGRRVRVLSPGENVGPAYVHYKVCLSVSKHSANYDNSAVYIILAGIDGQTSKIELKKPNGEKMEVGAKNRFALEHASVGPLLGVTIGASFESAATSLTIDRLRIEVHQQKYYFYPGKPITKKCPTVSMKKSVKGRELSGAEYTIIIHTGDRMGAGTDSNVFLNVYGNKECVHNLRMTNQSSQNKFERGRHDVFHKVMADVGLVQKIDLMTDSFGLLTDWFVHKVEIISPTRRYTFECDRWVRKDKDSRVAAVTLFPAREEALSDPAEAEYSVIVYTGDQVGAGTGADVFITIFGQTDKTETIPLFHSAGKRPTVTPFSKNSIDVFKIKATNVGNIVKVRLSHSVRGIGADWFVRAVEVLHNHKMYKFNLNRWICFDRTKMEASVDAVYGEH